MKKRSNHRELESNRIKSVRKRIIKKCLEMKEKLMLQRGLQQDEIENHVLIFRQMLFEKEEIPAHEEDLVDSPQKKTDTAKKSKSTKNKKVKGEKPRVIDNTSNQKSSEQSSTSKRKRTDSEISSKQSSPTVLGANGASSGSSHRKSKQLQKVSNEIKASSVRSHSSVTIDGATKDPSARKRTITGASHEASEPQPQQRRHSRSASTERRKSRSYSISVSPHERLRNRSSDRHSSYHRSHSGARSPSRSLSRSRSPSIRRRRGSPSHLDRRRITSARKRPVPYYRPSPNRSDSWSSYSRHSRSNSRSSFGGSPSPATLHRLRISRQGHSAFNLKI